MRSLARRLLAGDASCDGDADDLAQDAFLRALRQEREPRRARPWLARVLARLAGNHRRAARRRAAREQALASAAGVRPAPSPADVLAGEEARRRVIAAVLALDEPFRRTVLARFWECLPTERIAEREGIATATVRSRLKRGLDRLRTVLDAEHGGRAAWTVPLAWLDAAPAGPLALGAAMTLQQKALIAAVLVLAAGLAVVASGSSPAPPAATRSTHASPSAAAAGAPAPAARTAAATGAERGTGDDPLALARAVIETLPFPIVDEPLGEVTVRVLDRATQRPVAGAEVLYQPFLVDLYHPRTRGDRALHEAAICLALLETHGARTRTDDAGLARIAVPRTGGLVLARHEGIEARDHVVPAAMHAGEHPTLWLHERQLLVRVVREPSGAPAAGILLEVHGRRLEPITGAPGGSTALCGPADADGIVRVPVSPSAESVSVRPWGFHAARASIQLPQAFAAVTEVRCPETGSLRVELRTPSGRLWPGRIEVYGTEVSLGGPTMWASAEPGVHRVANVALGRVLDLRASAGGNERGHFAAAPVSGPTRPGEEVTVVLTTPAEPCILRARLTMPDGSAPPAAYTHFNVLGDTAIDENLLAPDGAVRWFAPAGRIATGTVSIRGYSRNLPRLEGTWRTHGPASPGEHDLGTIRLVAPELPVAVAGVLDVGSAPWSGGPVTLRIEAETPGGGWRTLAGDLAVDPAAATTFEVRERVDAARVRVTVLPARHYLAPAPAVVATGTRDVQLAIDRGNPLRARVLAPKAYRRAIRLVAVRTDGAALPLAAADEAGDGSAPRAMAGLLDLEGENAVYLWPALPPGSYRIDAFLPGVDAPLAVLADVHVEPAAAPDPRLDPLDLRHVARTLTIVVDPLPDGQRPITDGGALTFASGTTPRELHGVLFDVRGRAEVPVGPGPVDVLVAVPGHRLWRGTQVTGTHVIVRLEPCLHARLRLAPHVAERLGGRRVRAVLTPVFAESPTVVFHDADAPENTRTGLASLQLVAGTGVGEVDDAAATMLVPVSAPGRFAIEIEVQKNEQTWVPVQSWRPRILTPGQLEVPASGEAPVVVVDVPAAHVTKVLEWLAR